MSGSDVPLNDETVPQGPFALAGPMPRPAPGLPLRGDVAHIGLAGKYFVPHYAVPQPRAVMPGGAELRVTPAEDAEVLCTLMEGDSFGVLDVTGSYAWGSLSLAGPTGYVHLDRLETLS
ncbi:MAG: hypothetical protein ABIT09_07350 [Croceibacterium sp.]